MVQTFDFGDMIIKVHRPDLTEDERVQRMKSIKRASEQLLTEVRQKGKKDESK